MAGNSSPSPAPEDANTPPSDDSVTPSTPPTLQSPPHSIRAPDSPSSSSGTYTPTGRENWLRLQRLATDEPEPLMFPDDDGGLETHFWRYCFSHGRGAEMQWLSMADVTTWNIREKEDICLHVLPVAEHHSMARTPNDCNWYAPATIVSDSLRYVQTMALRVASVYALRRSDKPDVLGGYLPAMFQHSQTYLKQAVTYRLENSQEWHPDVKEYVDDYGSKEATDVLENADHMLGGMEKLGRMGNQTR